MSTVPGFPDATSPTPATGLLWLTEGSGSTRDKKVPAGTLMKDLLGRAVNEQAAAASPIAGATDLLPVARGNTGGKASVDAVVGAGLPGSVEALATAAALVGTEYVPVRTAANTIKRVLVSDLVQVHSADPEATTLVLFDNGVDSLLSVDGGAFDSIQVFADVAYRYTHVHASLNLRDKSASASNANPVEILVDFNGEFPGDFLGSLGIRGTAHVSVGTTPMYHRSFGVVAIRDAMTPPALYYRMSLYDMATGLAVPWSTIMPTNGQGCSMQIDIFGPA